MIVADTGAVIALIDADDRYHRSLRALFEDDPDAWILPWAILPEVYVQSAWPHPVETAWLRLWHLIPWCAGP